MSIVRVGRVSDVHPGTLMWTPAAHAELVRETPPYEISLTDTEWALIAPPPPATVVRGAGHCE